MLLLADENFPKPVIEVLRAEGHDVLWARTDHAGARDLVLLDLAEAEARIVLTLDKYFWQIAVQRRSPLEQSGVVLFRVHPANARKAGARVCCGEYCLGRTHQHHRNGWNPNARCAKTPYLTCDEGRASAPQKLRELHAQSGEGGHAQ